MGVILVYLTVGAMIGASIYAVADLRHWLLFAALCVAWFPLIFFGMIICIFIDLKEISNKLNR